MREKKELIFNAQCPMPNAQCPMPNAQCPMPNAQCLMPNSSELQFSSHLHINKPRFYRGLKI